MIGTFQPYRSDLFLDYLKGVAIILVVVGHSFQYFYKEWEPIYLPIRMFHMPFFIALSAYYIQKSCIKSTFGDFIYKKIVRLIFPVLSWGFLSALLHGGGKFLLNQEINLAQTLIGIIYANWFLSVLFIFSIIAAVIYRYAAKYANLCWIISIIVLYSIPSFWYMGNCKWLLPFFVLAIQFSNYKWTDIKLSIILPSIYVFVICYILFQDDHSLVSVKQYELSVHYNMNIIIRTLAGVAGTILVVYLSKWLYKWGALNKYIERLGYLSLPIYVIHTQMCDLNRIVNLKVDFLYVVFIISFLLVLLSLVIYKMCSVSICLKLFLFGEKDK